MAPAADARRSHSVAEPSCSSQAAAVVRAPAWAAPAVPAEEETAAAPAASSGAPAEPSPRATRSSMDKTGTTTERGAAEAGGVVTRGRAPGAMEEEVEAAARATTRWG